MSKLLSIEDYVAGIRAGNRVVLGRAITLIESTRPEHRAIAQEVIAALLSAAPAPADTLRIAITGAPGAGKSTFIEALGMYLIGLGHKVAVLAIDPSSAVSGGSILGDKTRMERLSVAPEAFIRPSPAGQSLGGVARSTRETIVLAEAAGYDIILIETVGVGQSEIAARRMADLFLLLLIPGAGDDLQGIKRGIVEMADLLVVNKADGDRIHLANQARAHYINATHLLPPAPSGWPVKVLSCSAQDNTGIHQVWESISEYADTTKNNGYLVENRRQQAQFWLTEAIEDGLKQAFYNNPSVQTQMAILKEKVTNGEISPFAAAEQLLSLMS